MIRLAQSFNDVAATTELAETVTFIESAWEVSLPTPTSYAGITTLALTLTGSDTIASQTENKINVVPQRKLQVVQDGASGTGPSGVGMALYTDA